LINKKALIMKNIKILSICFALLTLVACQDDDYEAPGDPISDVAFFTSIRAGLDPNVASEGFVSFIDASQGAISHEWTIDEGHFFLKEGFNVRDSLPLFINSDLGLSTDDKTAHVMFMEEGLTNVCLRNTFSEPVTFQSVDGPVSAVQEGDEWVFEKCFEFDVFAKEIKPAFKILQDGVEILTVGANDNPKETDSDTWPIVDVEVNKTLTFVDLSTVGRSNSRTWHTTGLPETSNDSIAEIAFLQFGTTSNIGWMSSSRIDPLPLRSDNKLIPLKVRVVSSSAPFEITGDINEDESEKLSFQVTGTIDAASLIGQGSSFTVNVVNAMSGFNQDIAVQSVAVSSSDATFIELTMAEPIYNTDEITISYTGGNILSSDQRPLADFSGKIVNPNLPEGVIDNPVFSFEVEEDRGNGGNTASWWTNHNNPWYFWGTTDDVTATDGIRVVRYHADDFATVPGGSFFWAGDGDVASLGIDAGTYRASIQVYREPGTTITDLNMQTDPWNNLFFDFSNVTDGEWTEVTVDFTINDPLAKLSLRMTRDQWTNIGVTGPQTFYIDDLQLIPLEVRP